MAMENSNVALTGLVQKYIGTAYDHVKLVAENIEDVNTLVPALDNVQAIVDNLADVTAAGANIDDIIAVSTIAGDVTSVAAVGSEIVALAAITTAIQTTATNIVNVNKVAAVDSAVTAVAGIDSEITVLAGMTAELAAIYGNISNIATVAADSADIGTVAGNIADVNAIAADLSDVNTVAANMPAILNALSVIDGISFTVADIAARDALVGVNPKSSVFVTDATADPTVAQNWAVYWLVSDGPYVWAKTAEYGAVDNIEIVDAAYNTKGIVALAGDIAAVEGTNNTTAVTPHNVAKVVKESAATYVDPDITLKHLIHTQHTNTPNENNAFYFITTVFDGDAGATVAAQQTATGSFKSGNIPNTPSLWVRNRAHNGAWSNWLRCDNIVNQVNYEVTSPFLTGNTLDFRSPRPYTLPLGGGTTRDAGPVTSMVFTPDGLNLVGLSAYGFLIRVELTTPFDIASEGSHTAIDLDIADLQTRYCRCLRFNQDGTKVLIYAVSSGDGANSWVYSINLTTAYDVGSADSNSFAAETNMVISSNDFENLWQVESFEFADSGDSLLISTRLGYGGDPAKNIFKVDLGTSYDLSTVGLFSVYDLTDLSGANIGTGGASTAKFVDNGATLFVLNRDGGINNTTLRVLKYRLRTPYNLGTMIIDTQYDIPLSVNEPIDILFTASGDKMLLLEELAHPSLSYTDPGGGYSWFSYNTHELSTARLLP